MCQQRTLSENIQARGKGGSIKGGYQYCLVWFCKEGKLANVDIDFLIAYMYQIAKYLGFETPERKRTVDIHSFGPRQQFIYLKKHIQKS